MAEEWLSPEEVVRREMNSLRGRLLSVIEAAGLPKGQEEAIKHLTKNITFQQQFLFEEIINTLDEEKNFKFKYGSNRYEFIEENVS